MVKGIVTLFFLLVCLGLSAQADSTAKKLNLTADFRFRIEQDWHSKKSDGSFRNDRSRLRLRFRAGLSYQLDKHSSFGGRMRTGNPDDQQGPHVTIGSNNGEFGLFEIGLEKLFYKFENRWLNAWAGKNAILLQKENELFWNDNVFPEGIALQFRLSYADQKFLNSLKVNAGHFIIRSGGRSFAKDRYFQHVQVVSGHWNNQIKIYPGFYYFKDIGDIPDGKERFTLSYSIFHLGASVQALKKPKLTVGLDFYANLQDYDTLDSIPPGLRDQKTGVVVSLKAGELKKKKDWTVHLYYARLEKFAVVDYFAQNDWARWDYSSSGATGSRLTNFHGIEVRAGYALGKKYNLVLRYYIVKQLIAEGAFKESGNRIRLDLNVGF